jgi:DNA-binding transcriptional MerR regulator
MNTIAAAARQTGINAATLRKWEARYGFPVPVRTTGDHRVFHASDVEALLEVSRRMAAGQRAGAAILAVKQGLQDAPPQTTDRSIIYSKEVDHALNLLFQSDLQSLEEWMVSQLVGNGAAAFCRDFAIPLIEAVGNLWQQGLLPIYAEHLFSSTLHSVLLQPRSNAITRKRFSPLVLLASPAGEQHTLALVLLKAVLDEANIQTVFVLGGLPVSEIAAAAKAFNVKVVALSASVACPPKFLAVELRSLRAQLESNVELWVGGGGTRRISSRIDGITVITSIDAAVQNLINKRGQSPNIVGTENDRIRAWKQHKYPTQIRRCKDWANV